MEFDFDRLKEQGFELANTAKKTAVTLANKGKEQVQLLEQQAKLSKAQRQLGALVYSLAKSGEENKPLVDKYIEAIDEIEKNIEEIKAAIAAEGVEPEAEPAEEPIVEASEEDAPAAEEETPAEEAAPAQKICPQCGAEVAADTLFCEKCGAQL